VSENATPRGQWRDRNGNFDIPGTPKTPAKEELAPNLFPKNSASVFASLTHHRLLLDFGKKK
jgi:hypothetical protein